MNKKSLSLLVFTTIVFVIGIVAIRMNFEESANKSNRSMNLKLNYLCDIVICGKKKNSEYRKYIKDVKRSTDPFALAVLETLGLIKSDSDKFDSLDIKGRKEIEILSIVLNNPSVNGSQLIQIIDTFSIPEIDIKVTLWKSFESSGWIDQKYIAENPQKYEYVKNLAIGLFQLEFMDYSIKAFKELVSVKVNNKKDPEVIAWFGSALTKRALYTDNNIQKIDFVKEGIKYLDQAVFDYPDYAVVRYIRANTYNSLPKIFNKEKLLKEDITFLVNAWQSGNKLKSQKKISEECLVNVDDAQLKKILTDANSMISEDVELRKITELFRERHEENK